VVGILYLAIKSNFELYKIIIICCIKKALLKNNKIIKFYTFVRKWSNLSLPKEEEKYNWHCNFINFSLQYDLQ